ncbi:hypothetical protein AQUSIP_23650 [Aquicella siphonis]|uniref:Capsule biosynthesis protein n=1 Tax=Aquicella siphonis TaxID=254247 RepID=A0A5E4PKH3_9COXI|nr:DUF6356 family protein [Aquicella siphonis]VVC77038.1 hypothetical protein AQUSIP_23650 [Aquicella siphonis]
MRNIFTEHPHSIGESYFQHMKFATLFGIKMITGGLACIIHAVLPFLFQKTGSKMLLGMTRHFVERMPSIDGNVTDLFHIIERKKAGTPVSLSKENKAQLIKS